MSYSPILKRIVNILHKKVYLFIGENGIDLGFRERDAIIVAGTARSGTTWIGDVIGFSTKSRVIFEPFLLNKDFEFVLPKQKQVDEGELIRNYQLYIPSHIGMMSKYYKDIKKILHGRIQSAWSDKQAYRRIFRHRVIKEIRANLFLGYIASRWPDVKIVFVIRNPYSVINSLIAKAKKGWGFDWDCNDVLTQTNLMQDYLQPYNVSDNNKSIAERLAHKWCIENLVALNQISGLKNAIILRYERLIRGEKEWECLSNFLSGYGWSEEKFSKYFRIPSFTTERKCDQVLNRIDNHVFLDAESKFAIEKIVTAYGLKQFLTNENYIME